MYKTLVNYNLAKESCKRKKKYKHLNRLISIKEIGKTTKELPQKKAPDLNISGENSTKHFKIMPFQCYLNCFRAYEWRKTKFNLKMQG